MASKKKSSRKRIATRNPVVREAAVLRKGSPHGKSTKAERAAAKRGLKRSEGD